MNKIIFTLVSAATVILQHAILILTIYALLLGTKAMQIYINMNSVE